MSKTINVGRVTSYADAVKGGYTGTREEWEIVLANLGTTAAEVEANRQAVAEDKAAVGENLTTVESYKNSAAQSASEALQSAESAHTDALAATAAKEAAQTAQGLAEEAKADAVSAKGAAESAQTAANASATAAAGSALAAQDAATTATAQAGAASDSATAAAASAASVSGVVADITQAKTEAISAIEAKGAETLDSIPDDYTELSGDVNDLQDAVNYVDIVIPRCYFWGHYYHDRGVYDNPEAAPNANNKYFELRLLNNISSIVSVYVSENTSNIEISDNIVSDIAWVTELKFQPNTPIRFLVRYNNGATNIPASCLSSIHMRMSSDGFDTFIRNYTSTYSDSGNANYSYYYEEPRRGCYGVAGRHATLYPFYNAAHDTVPVMITGTVTTPHTVYYYSQTGDSFTSETGSSGTPCEYKSYNGEFIWSGNGDQYSNRLSYFRVVSPDTSTIVYANTIYSDQSFQRTASACEYNGCYYFASDTDGVPLRKVDPATNEILATWDIDGTDLGHANGSNLVGNKWYISDWYNPNVSHILTISDDNVVLEPEPLTIPVTTYYPSVNRGLIYPINDYVVWSLSWDTVGDNDSGQLRLVGWHKRGTWKPFTSDLLVCVGIVQDITIVDDVIYIPISKGSTPNMYNFVGWEIYNIKTRQTIVLTTNSRSENEAVWHMDNVLKVVGANGNVWAVARYLDIDWDNMPMVYISDESVF